MKKTNQKILLFAFTFVSTYQSTNSIFLSLIVTSLISLLFYGIEKIWNLSFSRLIRILAICGLLLSISGFFYICCIANKYYSTNEMIKSTFSTEELEKIKTEFQKYKEINLEKEVEVIADNLSKTLLNEDCNIDMLLEQLDNIDIILDNPFIVNELEVSLLTDVRKNLIDIINASAQSYPALLNLITKIERKHDIIRTFHCDPVKVELYKALLAGPMEYIKYFEKLLNNAEGRIKLQRLCYLRGIEIGLLDILIEDGDNEEFKELAITCLLKQASAVNKYIFSINMNNYIQEKLPELMKTKQGQKNIIHDIRKLHKIETLRVKALCDAAEKCTSAYQIRNLNLKDLIKKEYASQIDNIIKQFGTVYE